MIFIGDKSPVQGDRTVPEGAKPADTRPGPQNSSRKTCLRWQVAKRLRAQEGGAQAVYLLRKLLPDFPSS